VRGQCGGFFPRAKTGLFLAFFGHVTYAHALRPHIDPIYWVLGVCGLYHVRAYSWSGDGHVLSRATPGIYRHSHTYCAREIQRPCAHEPNIAQRGMEYHTAGYGRESDDGGFGEREITTSYFDRGNPHIVPPSVIRTERV